MSIGIKILSSKIIIITLYLSCNNETYNLKMKMIMKLFLYLLGDKKKSSYCHGKLPSFNKSLEIYSWSLVSDIFVWPSPKQSIYDDGSDKIKVLYWLLLPNISKQRMAVILEEMGNTLAEGSTELWAQLGLQRIQAVFFVVVKGERNISTAFCVHLGAVSVLRNFLCIWRLDCMTVLCIEQLDWMIF